jgi:hypothetical protein
MMPIRIYPFAVDSKSIFAYAPVGDNVVLLLSASED